MLAHIYYFLHAHEALLWWRVGWWREPVLSLFLRAQVTDVLPQRAEPTGRANCTAAVASHSRLGESARAGREAGPPVAFSGITCLSVRWRSVESVVQF